MNKGRRSLRAALLLASMATAGVSVAQEDSDQGDAAELALVQNENQKKKSGFWERFRLGATVSFYSGVDKIRSDSANTVVFNDLVIDTGNIVLEPGIDGSTGRITLNPRRGDLVFTQNRVFIRDPRKDSGAFQDNSVEETLWLDFNAAYDIKSWKHGTLFLELDAGIYEGDVGQLEVAVDIAQQAILNPADQDATADDPFANFQYIYPTVGKLTQTPVSLAALWQFRPRSPFRPYIGLGIGRLEADLETSDQLREVNAQVAGAAFEWKIRDEQVAAGFLPQNTITARVISDTMWLAQGGLEYNINRNWSVYMAAKFISTGAAVEIRGLGFERFGIGITRNNQVNDIDGIGTEDDLLRRILSLPVAEAAALISDLTDGASTPLRENERQFFTSFPVALGGSINIILPNPIMPGESISQPRQTKLFVQGGNIQLDSFNVGFGFRYRY